MKNRITKSIVLGLVAIVLGLVSSTAAEARHWHRWYGGGYGPGYYNAYAAPAYGYGYGYPAYYGGGYGWHHRHYWGGRGPIGSAVRVW